LIVVDGWTGRNADIKDGDPVNTNWVTTVRRKVSTASTELNTARRFCTDA
ncbi:hypothetical protein Tco_1568548, partial [Tanacetum coccineum]